MRNMVSKMIKKVFPFVVALLAAVACSKPYELDLPLAVDSHQYNLSKKAGTARIFFYTTHAWNISLEPADCDWATLSRTSGDGKEPVEELLFNYDINANQDRQVTIVINAGGLHQKILMFQAGEAKGWWDDSFSVGDLEIVPTTPAN